MLYFPNHLNIETSDLCNRSCRYCPVQRDRDTSPARLLDLDVYERLLRELQDAPGPLKISLQWIDEPLTNPRFFDYAALGRELLPRASWLVQSNGDLLTAEHAERLKALFDGVVVNFYAESAWRAFERRQIDVVTARRPDLLQSPGRLERPAGAKDRSGEAVFHFNHKWHD